MAIKINEITDAGKLKDYIVNNDCILYTKLNCYDTTDYNVSSYKTGWDFNDQWTGGAFTKHCLILMKTKDGTKTKPTRENIEDIIFIPFELITDIKVKGKSDLLNRNHIGKIN